MEKQLEILMSDFSAGLAEVNNEAELKQLESEYLGKKGKLKAILAGVKDLSIEDKKTIGVKANEMKKEFIASLEKKSVEIEIAAFAQIEADEAIDVTIGYPSQNLGHKHPISHASELLEDIFISLGFKIEDGPQVETEEFAFDKLNIPADHPARDVWDTFWISDDINKDKDV
jgi:phenylalanyl-tRNA synthetase alpha chain